MQGEMSRHATSPLSINPCRVDHDRCVVVGGAVSPAVDSTHVDRIGSFCHISRVLPSCLVGDVQGSVDAHFATERRQHGTSF